jgi:hypothetical protein
MRKETGRHEPKRRSQKRSLQEPIDLPDWRRRLRPQILRNLVDQTRDLSWSRSLIDLLLDELHVGDEFDNLVGPTSHLSPHHFPQLVAIALVLRHSWFPEDQACITGRLGLSSALVTAPELASTGNGRHRGRGCASALTAASLHTSERRPKHVDPHP